MRRISCFLVALALVMGVCAPMARAADTPVVSISSGTVSPGGEVTLTLSLRNNPGIAGMMLYIYYDTSVFSADPNQDLRTTGIFRSGGGLIGNTVALARENGRYDGPAGKEGLVALWYNGSGMNATGDGDILMVTLRANANAQAGSYEIGVGYSGRNARNQEGEQVTLTVQSGIVTVTGSGTQSPAAQPSTPAGQGPSVPVQPSQNPSNPVQPSQNPEEIDPSPAPSDGPSGETPVTPVKPSITFPDIAGNWAEDYIQQAADRGLVVGDNGRYYPDNNMTRAEMVTILWRANGSPRGAQTSFTDLAEDWYREAVAWAEQTGVVNGVGPGRFDPYSPVSREQLATILHRMAGSPVGMEAMVSGLYDQQFTDSGKVSGWAKASLYWTVYSEIYCGEASPFVGQELAPQADASRAQIAVMMVRYLDLKKEG